MSERDDKKHRGEVVLRGVSKSYGKHTAASNVSFHAAPGDFISLIGPSGSGKTTTLMMIAGFTIPDSGSIFVDSNDITAMTPQKRQLGMVFQNYAIFPHMTVFDNVAFPLRVRKLPRDRIRERVDWALRVVKLEGFADRYSRQLSGGQQQRVALARAIVFEPRIILMDEPLGALDKNLRYHMQVELKELQKRLNTTVIYVTHDQEEAMNMSDKIGVMDQGRLIQIGTPSEVYQRPETRFVAKFLGEANLLPIAANAHEDAIVLGGGHLVAKVRPTNSPHVGSHLFVRPERMGICEIAKAKRADVNLAGTVTRKSFLGNIVRYAVDISGCGSVLVDRQNAAADPIVVGSAVSVSFDARDAMVLDR